MKINILTLTVLATILVSCSDAKDKELELREREIALREKELGINNELNDEQSYSQPKRQKTEKEVKQELFAIECNNPAKLLSGRLNYKPIYKNVLSTKVNGLKMTVTLNSKATIATITNAKLKVDFKSKTDVTIFSKSFVVYEYIEPNGTIKYVNEFEITNQQFEDLDHFSCSIISAQCK